MKTNMRKIFKFALATALMAGASALAQATPVTYSFTSTEVGAFGAGPYGTVTLNAIGSNITFTIALRSDMNFVNTGGPHSIFAFNALGVGVGDISAIRFNGVADSNVTVVTPGGDQPFGTGFSLMLDCTGGGCQNGAPGQLVDPLTFTVANATYSDFGFMAGGTTAFFASDVICITGGCDGSTGAIGVIKKDDVIIPEGDPLPEPASLALLGLGLIGVAAARRRR